MLELDGPGLASSGMHASGLASSGLASSGLGMGLGMGLVMRLAGCDIICFVWGVEAWKLCCVICVFGFVCSTLMLTEWGVIISKRGVNTKRPIFANTDATLERA